MKKKLLSMALSLIMIASLCSPALAVDDSIANDESTGYVLDESFGKMALPNRLERSSSDRSYLAKYRETYSAYQSNYNFNLNMGNPSGYIISQESCPNYHVGNSRFSRVGCEIAATYNALTAIGRKITVQSTIRSFEKDGYIMISGYAGSDPFAIGDYFDANGVRYTEYAEKSNYRAFRNAVNNNDSNAWAYIVSYWNSSSRTSLHTVMFTVDGNGTLHVYNRYSNADHIYTYSSLSSYGSNLPDRFIVGYVIYKDSRSI